MLFVERNFMGFSFRAVGAVVIAASIRAVKIKIALVEMVANSSASGMNRNSSITSTECSQRAKHQTFPTAAL